ncbi:hypothetical protein KSP39_PZI015183 [Platanthera zijinensis]|uniref:Uncharacterized protein n=1 Tax=Platanthera zijinensis TaxID=2320716 RepID=A0AAP0B9T2_9ASPA
MGVPAAKEPSPDDQAITRTTSSPGGGCMTRFMTSPFRALRRIRDMYVSSLGNCTRSGAASSRGGNNNKISATAGMVAIMPRARSRTAFGHNSYRSGPDGDDDFRELVRVNSKQVDAAAAAKLSAARPPAVTVVPRSQSVAASIGRIDEERPCEFDVDGDDGIKLAGIPTGAGAGPAYSRSRSCAVVPTERSSSTVIGFKGGLK